MRWVIAPDGHEMLRVDPLAAGLALVLAEQGFSFAFILAEVERAFHQPRSYVWFQIPEQQ